MSESNWLPDDDAALVDAVGCANVPTLMMVMVHLGGDPSLLRGSIRPRRASPQRPDGGLSAAEAAEVRGQALALLRAFRDRGGARQPLPALPSPEVLAEMMSFSIGQAVPAAYVPMLLADMQLVGDETGSQVGATRGARPFHVAVIGAGMSGLLAGIKLKQAGVSFSLIEKNADVGGTWFENDYPGCRVDLPNHFYSLSFEPNVWPDHFSRRDQLLGYFRGLADKYRLREATRFETEVVSARYDAQAARWQLGLRDAAGESTLHADAVISAVGQLNRPSLPALPGLEHFAGPAFHTARWPAELDLQGRRVGIVGTGASAMQVVPQLAEQAKELVIFQRSPQWAAPNADYFSPVAAGKQWLLRHVPYYSQWYRFRLFYMYGDGVHESLQIDPDWSDFRHSINAGNDRIRRALTEYIDQQIGDRPELRAKVLPDYPPFAKRLLIDNNWFRTLTRDNVTLETEPIEAIGADWVDVRGGQRHGLDALVFSTGFQANRFLWPMEIRGREGRVLHEQWGDDPRAYLGITMPGFPNFFVLYGPNTNLAHGGSIIFHSECQMRYVMGCLRLLFEGGHAALECRPDVHDRYNATVDAAHERMIWSHPHVNNWYRNSRGRVTTNSPWRLVDYWSMTRAPNPSDFVFTPGA
jgi:4-hydroxyacetophenone monooxygenase